MAEKWRVVSDYIGDPVVFDSLQGLLEALEFLGVNTDVLQGGMEKGGRRVLRTRAYTEGERLIMEAFREDFDLGAWYQNPSWETIAEALEEEEK